jgi:hypothetical protein
MAQAKTTDNATLAEIGIRKSIGMMSPMIAAVSASD